MDLYDRALAVFSHARADDVVDVVRILLGVASVAAPCSCPLEQTTSRRVIAYFAMAYVVADRTTRWPVSPPPPPEHKP
jgi:hypothetical protein